MVERPVEPDGPVEEAEPGTAAEIRSGPSRLDRTRILERARGLGFDLAGIADVRPSDHMTFYEAWIEEGHHGSMGYLARDDARARRADLRRTLSGVRSAVVVAQEYFVEDPEGVPEDPSRAVIARYARGEDYHRVLQEKLEDLLEWIRSEARGPDAVEGRVYVDTGPLLERELAQRAGIGWFGKNTMLLNPRKGSYFFLGVLLLNLDLKPTGPFTEDRCGTCSRCIEACPTDALLGRDETGAPVINARRCISYLTIEHRGPIPRELRPLMGNRVYGCDICQEVCPFNVRFAEETRESAYAPKPELDGPTLVELAEHLLPMSENEFLRVYEDSPISRARRKGLLRNVCIGLGNWLAGGRDVLEEGSKKAGDERTDGEAHGPVDHPVGGPHEELAARAVEVLIRALYDGRSLVRGHAAWALGFVGGPNASEALRSRSEVEEVDWVREECEAALSSLASR
ncbi:MAG: tRNA epoxyqueuosine(34) reductase QueG [Longimicrobiales bacterium]|nr:tRNA epoxyqueuosine(34) reductase QueG [Longimicrobiales bacterium]